MSRMDPPKMSYQEVVDSFRAEADNFRDEVSEPIDYGYVLFPAMLLVALFLYKLKRK